MAEANKIIVPIDLDAAQAMGKASQLRQAVGGVGMAGLDAGKKATAGTQELAGGMGAAQKATSQLAGQIVALGASYLSLQALIGAVRAIVDAYEKAIQLRDKFAGKAVDLMGAVAPAAAQFKVSESAMADFVTRIGQKASTKPGDVASIAGLITAAASAGLIGGVSEDQSGQVKVSPQDEAMLVSLTTFGQYTGATSELPALAKMLRKGMTGKPTAEGLQTVMAKTAEAFRKSQMDNWAEFIKGAIGGTASLLEQGVSFDTAISNYAALAKMEPSGVRAGETFRMIGERFFTGSDPAIQAEYERRYGKGSYWKDKQGSPDRMLTNVIGMLTEGKPEDLAKLYSKLSIPVEQGARLAKIAGAGGERGAIRGAMEAATPEGMDAELAQWSAGQRAIKQRADLAAELIEARAGLGVDKGRAEALRKLAAAELERLEESEPIATLYQEMSQMAAGEQEYAMRRRLMREAKAQGVEIPWRQVSIDISGNRPKIRYQAAEADYAAGTGALTGEEQAVGAEVQARLDSLVESLLNPQTGLSGQPVAKAPSSPPAPTVNNTTNIVNQYNGPPSDVQNTTTTRTSE